MGHLNPWGRRTGFRNLSLWLSIGVAARRGRRDKSQQIYYICIKVIRSGRYCSQGALSWAATCDSPMFCHLQNFVRGASHHVSSSGARRSAAVESSQCFLVPHDLTSMISAMHIKFSKFKFVQFALIKTDHRSHHRIKKFDTRVQGNIFVTQNQFVRIEGPWGSLRTEVHVSFQVASIQCW